MKNFDCIDKESLNHKSSPAQSVMLKIYRFLLALTWGDVSIVYKEYERSEAEIRNGRERKT